MWCWWVFRLWKLVMLVRLCKCRQKLIYKLIERRSAEKCTENIDEVKITEKALTECNSIECNSVKNIHKCSSCTLYIVLFPITFTVNVGIITYFIYSLVLKKKMLFVLSLVAVLKQQFNELINGKK